MITAYTQHLMGRRLTNSEEAQLKTPGVAPTIEQRIKTSGHKNRFA
jgi:hypothetical protein